VEVFWLVILVLVSDRLCVGLLVNVLVSELSLGLLRMLGGVVPIHLKAVALVKGLTD
jgi:hypothetical protein